MMDEIRVTCPHCGQTLYFIIKESGGIAIRSFDIYENSETIEILKSYGYEFGTAAEEGGDSDE